MRKLMFLGKLCWVSGQSSFVGGRGVELSVGVVIDPVGGWDAWHWIKLVWLSNFGNYIRPLSTVCTWTSARMLCSPQEDLRHVFICCEFRCRASVCHREKLGVRCKQTRTSLVSAHQIFEDVNVPPDARRVL